MDDAMEGSYKYYVYFECPDVDDKRKKNIEFYFKNKRKSCGGECGRVDVFKGNVYRIAFEDKEVQHSVLEKRDHSVERENKIVASFTVHETPESLLPDPSTVTTTPEADNPKVGLSSPPETKFPVAASPSQPMVQNLQSHFESSPLQNPLKEPSMAGQNPEDELSSSAGHAQLDLDKNRVIVSGAGKIQPEEFKPLKDREEQGDDKVKETFKHSQADKVDIVYVIQGNPAEAESPSIRVQPHPSGFHKAGSLSWEEPQRRPLSDQHGPRDHMGSAAREVQEGKGSQRYDLPGGVTVLVCRGDITKVKADALVNAANGKLDHGGGVAAALSHAGGPEVQRESNALVRKHGRYATGDAVMTTGGRLQCRKLIHIVGPVQGEANGRERELLTRSVGSVLKLADENKFQSIAIPCISSGIFKVPISLCAEAIVTAVSDFGSQSQHLKRITLIDTREEVVKALKAACESIFSSADAEQETAGDRQFHESPGASSRWSDSGANPVNHGEKGRIMNDDPSHKPHKQHEHREEVGPSARKVQRGKGRQCYNLPGGVSVVVCCGDITEEEADVLVNVANRNLKHDGGVAAALSSAGGPEVQQESKDLVREHGTYATGAIVMTTGGHLQCKKLIHIVRPVPGDENASERFSLKETVWSALKLADENEFKSIAMPCISSGNSEVLISECAEAIVSAVFRFGKQSQRLNKITLIDTREEVVEALKAACDRMFFSLEIAEPEASRDRQSHESTGAFGPGSNSGANPVNHGEEGRNMTDDPTHKPLKKHEHQGEVGPAARQVQGGRGIQCYVLSGGVKVVVCRGDITKEDADVLVTATNGYLDQYGGVAAALSREGGPEVQQESKDLVRKHGTYATGATVMTTGGRLKCQKLIHIVRPVPGDENGSEKFSLKESVWSALKLADDNEFKSIAMPCISSGNSKIRISECAEAIVSAVFRFGKQSQHLNKMTLIDTREEVEEALKAACDRMFSLEFAEPEASGDRHFQESTGASSGRSKSGADPVNTGTDVSGIKLETAVGLIEEQKVDAIVSPMKDNDPLSTGLGKILSEIIGKRLKTAFSKMGKKWQLPVEVDVNDLEKLHCHKVFFVNLLPWDEQHREAAVLALKRGLEHVLTSCRDQRFVSVAFPMLGTGEVLQFPQDVAESALLEVVGSPMLNRHSGRPLVVRIVVHPSDPQTRKAMTPQQTNSNAAPRASFSRYVLNHPDKDTAMVGGVKLELVRADIVDEKTDVIVNTINRSADQSGVSKAILEAAGTHVKDEFAAKHAALAGQKGLFSTGPGRLNCKDILHATFYSDPKMMRETCEIILKSFESKHHSSVSFPALGTGAGYMDPKVACTAMLDGIEAAVRSMGPTSLTLVRIVFKQRDVQKNFRSVLQNRCEETARQQQDDWEDLGTSTQSSSPSFSSSRGKPKPNPFWENCQIS
ncbi:uncharacterized protein LOC132475533 isoform X2 [Gadus macrocephalus]|uniref:uncharacterized protein LOC132475533 isoform X2 n=1 Tax=Gadus macrocephalus TaxID=80720 RepID=UPI0028CB84B9|nr:uncharacterized protein LOC132475533 isoform X2 [Gadus macrocephalus]